MKTRKEFLEAVMKMANLKDLQQADDAAQAVISLTKAIIGKSLSQKIAEVSPPDLRKGWESIEPSPVDWNWHNCGVKNDGTVACSGDNRYGQSTPPMP